MSRKERMFVDLPKSELAPGFIYLSETDLVHILFTDEVMNKSVAYRVVQRILGCPNAKSAEKKVVDCKGFLIQQLFFRTNFSVYLYTLSCRSTNEATKVNAEATTKRRDRHLAPDLEAAACKIDGSWVSDNFDLRDVIMNNDGVFQAINVPMILAIPDNQQSIVFRQLEEASARPDFKIQAFDEPDGSTTFYVNASAEAEGTIFRTYTAEGRASVLHVVQSNGKQIEQVSVDVFTAGIGATVGSYMGVEANVSLIKAKASIFDLNLVVGVNTGARIKDESFEANVAGCGFQIGRKVSISAFGSSFGIDFGRLIG
ncbi:hypothetical protein EDD21DRAFT_432101 [Dissophora ornata]|nr:hypothetical protein EDD21DRAFT_432101 [Dissophora ornata]